MRLVIFLDAVVHVAADEEIKILKKKKTESETFCMKANSENPPLSSKIHCYVIKKKKFFILKPVQK